MNNRKKDSAIRLIERVYWPRISGLGLAFIAVSFFLVKNDAPSWLWILLTFWGLIWPHVAHYSAKRADKPFKHEIINLFVDAFMIGFWVPVMSFSIVPSISIVCMHLLSIVSVLGLRKMFLGFAVELLGIAFAVLIVGFHFELEMDQTLILASLPMITIYPLFVGLNAYSLAVKLGTKSAALAKLSRIDGLTGLNNRTYWEEQLKQVFKLSRRENLKATIVFIDVDHFKNINDKYGHIVGDEVLQKIANLISDCARDTDICGRYGGEEFCILMPNTTQTDAHHLAERLRTQIANSFLHPNYKIKASISIGVSEVSEGMANYTDWLSSADKALYLAKEEGRNQTVVANN